MTSELKSLFVEWLPVIGSIGAFMLPFLYIVIKDAKHVESRLRKLTWSAS
jgi:hypothetical protein